MHTRTESDRQFGKQFAATCSNSLPKQFAPPSHLRGPAALADRRPPHRRHPARQRGWGLGVGDECVAAVARAAVSVGVVDSGGVDGGGVDGGEWRGRKRGGWW